jgi:prolyl oligopeptidase
MKRILILLLAALLAACTHAPRHDTGADVQPVVVQAAPAFPAPPVTEVRPVVETLHGVQVTDPYRWLEDQNSPETRAWIDRENAYTDSIIGTLPQRASLEKRLTELNKTDIVSTPALRGGRYFFTKRGADQDLFSIVMRERVDGPDVVLVDPAPLSANHTTSVDLGEITSDGKVMVYEVRQGGVDETTIHFFDVDARKDVGDVFPAARYEGLSLLANKRDVYYATHDAKGPRVFHHLMGTDRAKDELIFGEGMTSEKLLFTSISDDDRYLLIQVFYGSAPKKTEIYVKDLYANSPIRTVVNDIEARSTAEVAGDNLIIETNWNAPNSRVMIVPAANPGRENWRELVPENKNASIQSGSAAGGQVFVRYLEDVKPRVIGFGLDGTRQTEIDFPTIGSLGNVSGAWHSPEAFYSFSSFATPSTIYHYNVTTKQRQVFARRNIPVDPEKFEVKQVWFTSTDEARVPMFLLYRKGLELNGNNPVYLTGYGGFNSSQLPNFTNTGIVFAEHGGVYALANLRGGAEFGETWHQAGMGANKQHTFDDFIAAAEYLIKAGYTMPSKLAIAGGSNGGLLVGAAMTQRPELFKAVVCSFPLLDMLRFHKFLVGSFWVPEYGSADDPEQFRWLYSYSPYQHVVKGTKYPAVLFVTGDGDSRVAPLHARKMAALMQASADPSNPVLLRYHTAAGHSGGEPVSVQIRNAAEALGFVLWQLGVE